jgi:hypothetical protein
LWLYDRKKSIEKNPAINLTKYSKGTKVFFWICLSFICLAISGYLIDAILWYYFGFLMMILGIYGALISGVVLLILGLRDRSKPQLRGSVYPYLPAKPISIQELKNIIGISTKILIQDLANALHTNRANLLKSIAENRNELPNIHIEGEYLIISPESNEWVCPICGFVNYGPRITCKECSSPYSK